MLLTAIRGVSATADVSADAAELASRKPAAQKEPARNDQGVGSGPEGLRVAASGAVSRESLAEVLEAARERARLSQASLEFSVDDESGRTVVKVVDAQTKELIRQIPSEEVLAVARNLERIKGFLLSETA
jgi:flagellar protein FlaG